MRSHYPAMTIPEAPPLAEPAVPGRRSGLLDTAVEIGITVVVAVLLYLVIQAFLVGTYRVEQVSMLPTLRPDQRLLIDKLTPRFGGYGRGDIIVFHPPGAPVDSTPYIKRVIGVAGDHIQLRDGKVWVNGMALDEPYLSTDGPHHGATEPLEPDFSTSWDVPAGTLFAMGDHRARSVDSRSFGMVALDQVIGRAWLRFWPLDGLGLMAAPTYPGVPDAPGATTAP
jgi:signal peptidase I